MDTHNSYCNLPFITPNLHQTNSEVYQLDDEKSQNSQTDIKTQNNSETDRQTQNKKLAWKEVEAAIEMVEHPTVMAGYEGGGGQLKIVISPRVNRKAIKTFMDAATEARRKVCHSLQTLLAEVWQYMKE